jgi:hypothetical protein
LQQNYLHNRIDAARRHANKTPMPELFSSRLPRQSTPVPVSTLTVVLIAVVVVGGLYFGREVLVPIALALLLSLYLHLSCASSKAGTSRAVLP